MSSYNFLSSLDLDENVKSSLSLLLDRTTTGTEDVLLTPLGQRIDPEKLLSDWDSVFNSGSSELNSTLFELESDNRSKYGPRSVQIPWLDRIDGVESYFGEGKRNVPISKIRKPPRLGLRPLTFDKAVSFVKNNTNSGLPYFTRKGDLKDIYSDDYIHLLSRKDPCCLFTRTQEQRKTRTVWGYPMADTILELRYYRPLLKYQRKTVWRSALTGPSVIDKRITEIISNSISSGRNLLSIDFSQYDSTVKTVLQKECFNYIKTLFRVEHEPDIDYISDRFLNIGLVTPDGIWNGPHGVPSGSTFTNEVDSIAQYLVASTVVDESNFDIQGDDGAYSLTSHEIDNLKYQFSESGLIVNDSKSYISSDYLIYLQNLYHSDYRRADGIIGGIYPTYRALNRLVYQERFNDFVDFEISGADFYSIRTISILENCKHHPLFADLVKFVYERDKYKLEFSEMGLQKYIKRFQSLSGTEGMFTNQYGEDFRGLRSFETMKILNEL